MTMGAMGAWQLHPIFGDTISIVVQSPPECASIEFFENAVISTRVVAHYLPLIRC